MSHIPDCMNSIEGVKTAAAYLNYLSLHLMAREDNIIGRDRKMIPSTPSTYSKTQFRLLQNDRMSLIAKLFKDCLDFYFPSRIILGKKTSRGESVEYKFHVGISRLHILVQKSRTILPIGSTIQAEMADFVLQYAIWTATFGGRSLEAFPKPSIVYKDDHWHGLVENDPLQSQALIKVLNKKFDSKVSEKLIGDMMSVREKGRGAIDFPVVNIGKDISSFSITMSESNLNIISAYQIIKAIAAIHAQAIVQYHEMFPDEVLSFHPALSSLLPEEMKDKVEVKKEEKKEVEEDG